MLSEVGDDPNAVGDDRIGRRPVTAGEVEALVASAFQVDACAFRVASRGTAAVAFARQVAMYLIHTRLGAPYTAAGAIFGRDRTTAAHACRLVEERREDPRIDSALDYLERAIDLCPHAFAATEASLAEGE
jgi:chromosomal replication initiation ATPase DnaA